MKITFKKSYLLGILLLLTNVFFTTSCNNQGIRNVKDNDIKISNNIFKKNTKNETDHNSFNYKLIDLNETKDLDTLEDSDEKSTTQEVETKRNDTNLIEYNDNFWNSYKEYNFETRSDIICNDFKNKNLNDIKALQDLITEQINEEKNSNILNDTPNNIEKLILNDISQIEKFGEWYNLFPHILFKKQMLNYLCQWDPKEGFLRTTQNSDKKLLVALQRLTAILKGNNEGLLYDCLELLKLLQKDKKNSSVFYLHTFEEIWGKVQIHINNNNGKLKNKKNWDKNRTFKVYKLLLTYFSKYYNVSYDLIYKKTDLIAFFELPKSLLKKFKGVNLVENGKFIYPTTGLVIGGNISDGGMDCSTTATTISSGTPNEIHIYPWHIEYYWLLSVHTKSKDDKKFGDILKKYLKKFKLEQVYDKLLKEAKKALLDDKIKKVIEYLYEKFTPIIPELNLLKKGDVINHREISGMFRFGHSSLFIDKIDKNDKFIKVFHYDEELEYNDKFELYIYNKKDTNPNKSFYKFLTVLRPRKNKPESPCKLIEKNINKFRNSFTKMINHQLSAISCTLKAYFCLCNEDCVSVKKG